MTILPISNDYRSAILSAIVIQSPLVLFFYITLYGDDLARVEGYTLIGFWVGAAIIMFRRPRNPKRSDLAYIRWGYLWMVPMGILIDFLVLSLKHGSWGG